MALWVTYVLQKKELDAMEVELEAAQRNVMSFLVYSILATVFTVSRFWCCNHVVGHIPSMWRVMA